MSTGKHTPGPWRVRPDTGHWSASSDALGSTAYEGVLGADQVVALVVAHSPDPWGEVPPTEHNARLIAAAPELLSAMAELLAQTQRCFALTEREESAKVRAMDKARAAIAKATQGAAS